MNLTLEKNVVESGYDFKQYLALIEDRLSKDQTTGAEQSREKIETTELNLRRMKRILKTGTLSEPVRKVIHEIKEPLYWIVLAEAWCGDGAQVIPYLAIMAGLNRNIRLKILLRDEHPEIMDLFLTDGKRSIPKLICLDRDFNVNVTWGPRPGATQELFLAYQGNPGMTKEDFHMEVHLWYARDRGKAIVEEIYKVLENCPAKSEVLT